MFLIKALDSSCLMAPTVVLIMMLTVQKGFFISNTVDIVHCEVGCDITKV